MIANRLVAGCCGLGFAGQGGIQAGLAVGRRGHERQRQERRGDDFGDLHGGVAFPGGTGPGEFGLPHNLVVDDQGRVYVTDRDNQRVEVFDADGQFLAEWPTLGGNSALFLTEDQHIWTGGMLRSLDGEPVATLPGGDGGHGMTVTDDGEVFVAQLRGRIQKFVSEEIESEEKEP